MPRSMGRVWRSVRNCRECGTGSWDRGVGSVWGENRGGIFDGSGGGGVGDGSWSLQRYDIVMIGFCEEILSFNLNGRACSYRTIVWYY